jgi:Caspase domain
MKRRVFLQSGAALGTAFGVGQLLLGQSQAAWAALTSSKFALLMGVDRYPVDRLKGSVTDVELQANLLVHRFGFPPENVLRLTDAAATVAGVKQAFAALSARIQADDWLVVHFSGKSAVGPTESQLLFADDEPLGWSELGELLKRSRTKHVITVLDTDNQGDGPLLPGNRRRRAAAAGVVNYPPSAEADAALPGMVLSAAAPGQTVVEVDYPDFSAGQFTYDLTQMLWQTASPSALNPARLGTVTGTKREQQFLNGLLADSPRSATIGTLLSVDPSGLAGTVWLGGLPAAQVALLNPPALLQTGAGQTLQVTDRQGLQATVRLPKLADQPDPTPLTLTTPIAEQLRVLPKDLALALAIDQSLSKVERIDAVGAFSSLPNVDAQPLGDSAADLILAKIQPDPTPNLVAALPDVTLKAVVAATRYALLNGDRQPLVFDRPEVIALASGEASTAVKTMVKRFAPIVESLYADKVLRLLDNQASSQLAVTVSAAQLTPAPKLAFRQSTAAAQAKPERPTIHSLAVGTQLRYRATNQSALPLYWLLIGWNSRHETYVVLPAAAAAPLATGAEQDLAFREDGLDWAVRGPLGGATLYFVASDRPFTQTAIALQPFGSGSPDNYLYPLTAPLGVIQALLQDLSVPEFASGAVYGLAMARYVALPLQYQVV